MTRLTKLLEKYVVEGRSTPGAPQQNTTPVNIWKAKPNVDPSKAKAANKAQKAKGKRAGSAEPGRIKVTPAS